MRRIQTLYVASPPLSDTIGLLVEPREVDERQAERAVGLELGRRVAGEARLVALGDREALADDERLEARAAGRARPRRRDGLEERRERREQVADVAPSEDLRDGRAAAAEHEAGDVERREYELRLHELVQIA